MMAWRSGNKVFAGKMVKTVHEGICSRHVSRYGTCLAAWSMHETSAALPKLLLPGRFASARSCVGETVLTISHQGFR